MQNHAQQAECLGTIDFIGHRSDRLTPQQLVGGRQVDEIAGVRHNRTNPACRQTGAELPNLFGRHEAAAPLVGVLGEDLKGATTMRDRTVDGQG
jgi:hypothetical protein